MKPTTFTINDKSFNLPVLDYELSYEVLDGKGSGRMEGEGWPMFRDPQGLIINIDMVIGLTLASNNPDFQLLLSELKSFGTVPFKKIGITTPSGIIEQDMYGASFKIKAKRFEKGGVTYWGSLPVKFRAQRGYGT